MAIATKDTLYFLLQLYFQKMQVVFGEALLDKGVNNRATKARSLMVATKAKVCGKNLAARCRLDKGVNGISCHQSQSVNSQ